MSLTITIEGGAVQLSGNPVKITVHTSATTGTNYKVMLKVTSTDGALLGGPFIDAITPDTNGDAYFDISGLVNQPIDYEFEYPLPEPTTPPSGWYVEHDLLAFEIALDIGETYIDANDDLVETWEELTGTEYEIVILKGGVSNRQLAAYAEAETSFYEEVVASKKFLTNQPERVTVGPNTPSKLWYISEYATPTVLALQIVVYWIGDPNPTIINNPITIQPGVLYEFHIHPSLFGFDPYTGVPGDPVAIYYRAQLIDGTNPFVDMKYFDVDTSYYEQETNLFYANSIGGVDCLWCTGKARRTFETKTQTAQRPLARVINPRVETITVTNKTGQRKWEINTGFKSKTEIAALQDFLLAKKIWLVDSADVLVPVYLEDKDQLLEDITGDILVDKLDLVLLEGHEDEYY